MASVMIVEDDDYVRECVYRRFVAEGWSATQFGNPTEAFDWAQSQPLDLIVTDVVMPEMNGTELVNRLRSTRPELHAILMSGYPESYLKSRYETEVAPLLQKPFQMKTLLARANAMLHAA
jgi:DNA-binding response OmpR family regulator